MSDLAEFLLARIAEDESAAEDALDRGFGGWEDFADRGVNFEERTHIARHDPARVLAQCATHRAVVDELYGQAPQSDAWHLAQRTLRALASIWAEHPDFDPTWRLT